MHPLLEEFKISLKSSLSPQSLCHTISPIVEFGPESERKFLVPESESGVLNFLTLESESESHKKTRTPHPCTAQYWKIRQKSDDNDSDDDDDNNT